MRILKYVLFVAITACSTNSDSYHYASDIVINGQTWAPDRNDDDDHFDTKGVRTRLTDNGDGTMTRQFILSRYGGFSNTGSSIRVSVKYDNAAGIDNAYVFSDPPSGTCDGVLHYHNFSRTMISGTITVSAKSNNRFKLEFDNVKALYSIPGEPNLYTLHGSFDGTFLNLD